MGIGPSRDDHRESSFPPRHPPPRMPPIIPVSIPVPTPLPPDPRSVPIPLARPGPSVLPLPANRLE
ncbi:hypothetical protein SLEP1_g1482 [Rubroshorea leprosula]|uniref:Uncharacterized protein n=1 Tax=Rubroshorea leprosula TaxID=152421 RepID=A0AAV5HPD1_9ROSI|nr:hypothetical protein SLEP1_g1482 [Rubroshorea leprosula]